MAVRGAPTPVLVALALRSLTPATARAATQAVTRFLSPDAGTEADQAAAAAVGDAVAALSLGDDAGAGAGAGGPGGGAPASS